MESSQHHHFLQNHHQILKQSLPADDPQFPFEPYTIPTHSAWFSWDNIHEIEKLSLKEFFDGSSFTRTPRIYKEYRDFIISKYREDPSRRLTFSEVRRSLVGDVNYLRRVFSFLDRWGLVNFGVTRSGSKAVVLDGDGDGDFEVEEGRWKVRVEEGPPNGVRVVAVPNSLKPVSLPPNVGSNHAGGALVEIDLKMPPLSSHSDVYRELIELVCGNCKERCDSSHYKHTKEDGLIICVKCFKNGNYGKNKSVDDYKFVDCTPSNGTVAVWTEAETLLLLESVLKHGDDWDLVAQNVQTKSKLDCISRLIQLPFGHLMLGSAYDRCRYWDTSSNANSLKQGQGGLPVSQEVTGTGDQHGEPENKTNQQNGDADDEGPPLKRVCTAPIPDSDNSKMEQTDHKDEQAPSLIVSQETLETESQHSELKKQNQQEGDVENQCPTNNDCSAPISSVGNSLMKQVARISAVVGPQVTASAAEAAVAALCDENQCPREIFDSEEEGRDLQISLQTDEAERTPQGNDSEVDERPNQSVKSSIPLPLRMRAATATALGAAAAHAKLLAIQEDREVEKLVSTIINSQLKKLQFKMKLLKDLELIMEKEYAQMEELEESLLVERMDVIQRIIDSGISRWRDRPLAKPQVETIL